MQLSVCCRRWLLPGKKSKKIVSPVYYEWHIFQDPALLLKVMAMDIAAQGPDMLCYFTLMAYNQRKGFFCLAIAQH